MTATQGPWAFQSAGDKGGMFVVGTVAREDDSLIGGFIDPDEGVPIDYIADVHSGYHDARLIAAVTDLLTAIEAVETWLGYLTTIRVEAIPLAPSMPLGELRLPTDITRGDVLAGHELLATVRASRAKAKGEEGRQ